MSSWRKLMTPIYDKYMPQESMNSAASQSRVFRNASARSTMGIDSVNSSLCNEKLQKLQSEMNRLKSELNKYPNSSRTIKTLRSSRSHVNNTNFSIEEDSSGVSDEEITTRRTRNDPPQESQKKISENRYSERNDSYEQIQTDETPIKPTKSNKKPNAKNLMSEYDIYHDNPFGNDISQMNDNEISIVDHIHEKKDIGISAEISPSMTYHEAKRQQPVLQKYKEEMKTEKPRRKVVEKKTMDEDEEVTGGELKRFLFDCQNEIHELKEIVLHSKKKIDSLQDELEGEKKKSYKLRQELQRQSTLKLPKIDESQDVSCLPEVESPIAKRIAHRSINSSIRESRRNLSLEGRESRQAPLFHSGSKSREFVRESHQKPPGSDIFKWFKEKNKRSQYVPNNNFKSEKGIQASLMPSGNNSTSSGGGSRTQRTTAVQCDFMLEKIADFAEEEQLEEQKRQISNLSSQVLELKSSKNKMIETFQEIIDKLANPKTTNTQHAKIEEVKDEFNGFYSEFQSKMNSLNKSRMGDQPFLKREKENSPNHANIQNYGASRNNNMLKTYISDNLIYSPSNIGASFLEGLESKPFPTLKVESPFVNGGTLTQTVRSFALSPKHL